MRWIVLLQLLALGLTGCAGPAGTTNVTGNEEAAARKLYVAKCAKCHKFYDPAKYSDDEWKIWMGKMSKKAKLNPQQARALSSYIDNTFRHPQQKTSVMP